MRHGGCAPAADPGVRRNEQHQPGNCPAPGPAGPWRAGSRRTGRLGSAGLRAVLHQPGPGGGHQVAAVRTLRAHAGGAHGRPGAADHAQRWHPAQLPERCAAPAGAPWHPAPGRAATSRQAGPAAAVQGRREPAAGQRPAAAGRSVRPDHRGGGSGRCPATGRSTAPPARPADCHPDRRN
ncbi:hypothetical protein D3C71_1672760 [compost metagenome]